MQAIARSSSACAIVCATGAKHCERCCDHRLPCQGRAHFASLAGVARATFSKYPPKATRKSVLLLLTSNDEHLWMALGGASGRCGTGPSTRDGRSLDHPALRQDLFPVPGPACAGRPEVVGLAELFGVPAGSAGLGGPARVQRGRFRMGFARSGVEDRGLHHRRPFPAGQRPAEQDFVFSDFRAASASIAAPRLLHKVSSAVGAPRGSAWSCSFGSSNPTPRRWCSSLRNAAW